MNAERFNLHATALTVQDTGILFVGPSGSGKSELAFSFLTEAERCGLPAALIADDQIFVYRDFRLAIRIFLIKMKSHRWTGLPRCDSRQ